MDTEEKVFDIYLKIFILCETKFLYENKIKIKIKLLAYDIKSSTALRFGKTMWSMENNIITSGYETY